MSNDNKRENFLKNCKGSQLLRRLIKKQIKEKEISSNINYYLSTSSKNRSTTQILIEEIQKTSQQRNVDVSLCLIILPIQHIYI